MDNQENKAPEKEPLVDQARAEMPAAVEEPPPAVEAPSPEEAIPASPEPREQESNELGSKEASGASAGEENEEPEPAPEVETLEEEVEEEGVLGSDITETVVEAAAVEEPEELEKVVEESAPSPIEAGEEQAAADAAAEAEQKEEDETSGFKSQLRELSEEQAQYPWYVVHTYSGYEMNAKRNLEERVKQHNLLDRFGNIIIPQETVVELVRGQKKTSTRKFFPGYILVQVNLDDETWHLVKETPKVTGFVGNSRDPAPLTPQEVETLVQQMEGGAAAPQPKVHFEEGDSVKVIDGPFTDFNGTVDEVRPDKGKLRVLISIFGRNTPVELDFVQVEKA